MNNRKKKICKQTATRPPRRIALPIIIGMVLGITAGVVLLLTMLNDKNGLLIALSIGLSLEAAGFLVVGLTALSVHLYPPKRGRMRIRTSELASPVRESWKVLPAGVQRWLTRVSGKPLASQSAMPYKPWRVMAGVIVWLALGVSLSVLALAVQGWGWLLLVPGWIITTAQMRMLALTVLHFASHNQFTGSPKVDKFLGQLASVVLVIENFTVYKAAHPGDHHGGGFMSDIDPTIKYQRQTLGLWPGMTRQECWAAYLSRMISPVFHLRLIGQRLYGNWAGATGWHRVGTIVNLSLLAAIGSFGFATLAVCWLAPLIVCYNISLSTRPVFEHHFPPPEIKRIRCREGIAACTHAIFFGSPAPSPELPWLRRQLSWAGWWVGFVCWHLPLQAVFCPYPAQVHDLHHRHPDQPLNPDHLYARQGEIEAGTPGWPAYTEIWGLMTAIDECFRTISEVEQGHQEQRPSVTDLQLVAR